MTKLGVGTLGVLLVAASTGCVSMGPDYDVAAVDQLKPGMAKAEVIAQLGRPTSTVRLPDGREQLMWVHSRGTMLGTAKARSVMLMFDAAGTYSGMVSQAETDLR